MLVLNVNYVKLKTGNWWVIKVVMVMMMTFSTVRSLTGPNVCVENKTYNVTKLVKYKVPVSIRTYEWCMAIPPRCSKYKTEMQYVSKQETEERTAEVAVCCPGYKAKGVSCVFSCPPGKYGPGCSMDCPPNKWGSNCGHECKKCGKYQVCSPSTGQCLCVEGRKGERCEIVTFNAIDITPKMPIMATPSSDAKKTLIVANDKNIRTATKETTTPIEVYEANEDIEDNDETEATTLLSKTTKVKKVETTTIPITTTTKEIKTTTIPINTSEMKEVIYRSKSTHKATKTPLKTTSYNIVNPTYTLDLLPIRPTEIKSTTTTELFIETTPESTTDSDTETSTERRTVPTTRLSTSTTTTASTTTSSTTIQTSSVSTTEVTTPSTQSVVDTSTEKTRTLTTQSYKKSMSDISHKAFTTLMPATLAEVAPIQTSAIETRTTEKKIIGKAERTQHIPTIKFTPREFWIKPAQKGETPTSATKINASPPSKHSTKKEPFTSTTPRTIIVSIIPTSISYPTFKKVLLTTTSSLHYQQNKKRCQQPNPNNTTDITSQPFCITFLKKLVPESHITSTFGSTTPDDSIISFPSRSTNEYSLNVNNTINSMLSTTNVAKSSSNLTSPNVSREENVSSNVVVTPQITTDAPNRSSTTLAIQTKTFALPSTIKLAGQSNNSAKHKSEDLVKDYVVGRTHPSTESVNDQENTSSDEQKSTKLIVNNVTTVKANAQKDVEFTSSTNTVTTQMPAENETFHILTEPEHITAVITDDERRKSRSLDLLTVLTVAGAVMMSVITVAVIIVMLERCKKPPGAAYETSGVNSTLDLPLSLGKTDTLDMKTCSIQGPQPPRYIQSIYKSPLPVPPTSSDHYQPIDTLDRSLKPFMRPVAVKQLTPRMIDNFRDILECHYDHLPRRNITPDFRQSTTSTPSMCATDNFCNESYRTSTLSATVSDTRHHLADFSIEEPLYAEIPGWGQNAYPANEADTYSEATTEL